MKTEMTRQCDYSWIWWTSSERRQSKGLLDTRTAWLNTTTLGSATEISKLETSFLEGSWAPPGTPPKENLAPTGKDLTGSQPGRERVPTTWRLQTGGSCHTHGTPNTYESTTSRSGGTERPSSTTDFSFLPNFIVYFYVIIYFSFRYNLLQFCYSLLPGFK